MAYAPGWLGSRVGCSLWSGLGISIEPSWLKSKAPPVLQVQVAESELGPHTSSGFALSFEMSSLPPFCMSPSAVFPPLVRPLHVHALALEVAEFSSISGAFAAASFSSVGGFSL